MSDITEVNVAGVVKPKRKKAITIETLGVALQEKAKMSEVKEKREFLTKVPVPEGHIRCICLVDYKGMEDDIYAGDVQDLPQRRYKTLSMRGFVKPYEGERPPNKLR